MTAVRQVRTADAVVVDLPDAPLPLEALGRLEGLRGRVLLHSAGGGRYSFLAADPLRILTPDAWNGSTFDPFRGLEDLLRELAGPPPPEGIPFAGGVVGFLGYEAGDVLERLPAPPRDDVGMPAAWFGVYDRAVVWDHEAGACRVVARVMPDGSAAGAGDRLQALVERLAAPRVEAGDSRFGASEREPVRDVESSLSRPRFEEGVRRIQEYIRAGDLFQANLTRRISVRTGLSGIELYRRLLRVSPAAFSAYLDTDDGEVASISPELFLSVRSREVVTRPIKGTAARGRDAGEDRRLGEALEASAKDRAENVMIVDLLRNDLSRVCRPGSVAVPRLAALETHPTVHHLVSTVTATLAEGAGPVDLLRATFPGGSITGAPKIRAMEILRELEPVRRGVYTGALGILGFHGDLDLSIAIRTAVLREGRVHYGTGGGITLASRPDDEWTETEDKAGAFFQALDSR